MNSERWQKIKEIFNEAAEIPAAERRHFLDKFCNGDAAMRGEIEKMLAFADDENDSFENNAFELFTNDSEKIPVRIGKYKIKKEIGRGGMGAVYEAIFETADFSQRVAIKIIKRGMDTDQILSRFRHEQKILASLVHPNIAQFLDGGMTEDNLPFYAMEFVEGRFIDDFCREENLNLNERLQLFRQVCSAVQTAHQNLIIHRDLKPRNILVCRDGTPKLLDFGIGKILTPDAETEEIGTATQLGMMTPAYASPEQIQGKRIGTTSDIYSLGVILYELLTGEKPYKFSAGSQLEIERAVCESEPVRPSSAARSPLQFEQGESSPSNKQRTTNNRQLTKSLKGDLDNIILKCLRKEPAARYASVQEFSEDIRRYLFGLPVFARPHTPIYRAAKFISRNRAGVAAAAIVFMSLCVGITVAIWQAHRAEQQRVLAEKRFADVRQLANNVVFKYHDAIADLPGSTAAREMLVRDALAYLDQLGQETTDDIELQKELALAYLKMGDVQGKMYAANVGNTEGALASYKKSIALFESTLESKPADLEAKDSLIQAYDNLAFLMLRSGGDARTLVEKALKLYEQIPKNETNNSRRTLKLIDLYIRYGDTKTGNRTEALAEHQKALSLLEELLNTGAQDYETIKASARTHQRIGTDYLWLGRQAEERGETEEAQKHFAQSLIFHEKSLAATERMFTLAPDKPESERYLAAAYSNSAESLAAGDRTDEALQMMEKMLRLVEKTQQADPNNQETKLDLSVANEILANISRRRGDDAQAINYAQKSLAIDEAIYESDKKNLEVLGRIAEHHKLLAEIYALRGETERAEFHRRKVEEILKNREARTN